MPTRRPVEPRAGRRAQPCQHLGLGGRPRSRRAPGRRCSTSRFAGRRRRRRPEHDRGDDPAVPELVASLSIARTIPRISTSTAPPATSGVATGATRKSMRVCASVVILRPLKTRMLKSTRAKRTRTRRADGARASSRRSPRREHNIQTASGPSRQLRARRSIACSSPGLKPKGPRRPGRRCGRRDRSGTAGPASRRRPRRPRCRLRSPAIGIVIRRPTARSRPPRGAPRRFVGSWTASPRSGGSRGGSSRPLGAPRGCRREEVDAVAVALRELLERPNLGARGGQVYEPKTSATGRSATSERRGRQCRAASRSGKLEVGCEVSDRDLRRRRGRGSPRSPARPGASAASPWAQVLPWRSCERICPGTDQRRSTGLPRPLSACTRACPAASARPGLISQKRYGSRPCSSISRSPLPKSS